MQAQDIMIKMLSKDGGKGAKGAQHNQSASDADNYFYFLQFLHNKQHGRDMQVRRRREDVVFSSRYSRDQPTFEKDCIDFIFRSYYNK